MTRQSFDAIVSTWAWQIIACDLFGGLPLAFLVVQDDPVCGHVEALATAGDLAAAARHWAIAGQGPVAPICHHAGTVFFTTD